MRVTVPCEPCARPTTRCAKPYWHRPGAHAVLVLGEGAAGMDRLDAYGPPTARDDASNAVLALFSDGNVPDFYDALTRAAARVDAGAQCGARRRIAA